jgi:hypothetical protein
LINPAALLADLRSRGFALQRRDKQLLVNPTGAARLTDEDRVRLVAGKEALLALLDAEGHGHSRRPTPADAAFVLVKGQGRLPAVLAALEAAGVVALDIETARAADAGPADPDKTALNLALHRELRAACASAGLAGVADLEERALLGVLWVARSGVFIDQGAWLAQAAAGVAEAARWKAEADRLAPARPSPPAEPWRWDSSRDLRAAFGIPSAGKDAIRKLAHPRADLLRAYRAAEPLKGSLSQEKTAP